MKIIENTQYGTFDAESFVTAVIEAENIKEDDVTVIFYTSDSVYPENLTLTASSVLHAQNVDGDFVVVVSYTHTNEAGMHYVNVEYMPDEKVTVFRTH